MAQGVVGSWYLDLKIAGQNIPANPSNLPVFNIINNIHQNLPSIQLVFNDGSGTFAHFFNFKDGTPIEVSFGVEGIHIYEGMKFIMLGPPQGSPTDSSLGIRINGVLDNIGWLRKVADKPVKGNSSDVFTKWASDVGLTVDADSTNDSMTWLTNRTNISDYLRFVAERSWASATSCIMTAVTDAGKAKFKDVDKLIQGGAKKTFSDVKLDDKTIPILSWEVASKQHVLNSSRAYGATTMSTKPDGTTIELNEIEVRQIGNAMGFFGEFAKEIGKVGNRILQLPPLSGNTHDKYVDAIHQNKRIKSTYGFDLKILTDTPSAVELLDVIRVVPFNPALKEPLENLVGNYVVTSQTKSLSKRGYVELITCTSQGA